MRETSFLDDIRAFKKSIARMSSSQRSSLSQQLAANIVDVKNRIAVLDRQKNSLSKKIHVLSKLRDEHRGIPGKRYPFTDIVLGRTVLPSIDTRWRIISCRGREREVKVAVMRFYLRGCRKRGLKELFGYELSYVAYNYIETPYIETASDLASLGAKFMELRHTFNHKPRISHTGHGFYVVCGG